MKNLFKKFENTMVAVAFAEANEPDTAREILMEKPLVSEKIKELRDDVSTTIYDITSMTSTAMVFAESGEMDRAVEILKEAGNRLEEIKTSYKKTLNKIIFAASPKTSSI